MADNDAVILSYSLNPIEYKDVQKVWLTHPSSTEQAQTLVPFTYGEAVRKTVEPNFASGNIVKYPIPAGELVTDLTLVKPEDLKPENIAEGMYIAGVGPGTHVGGGGGESERPMESKPIRFYDPYGNVIYGYTRAEAKELTELPPGPALKGLSFDRWTHTLEEIQSVEHFADVGPMYMYGSSPAAILIVETLVANTAVKLQYYCSSSAKPIVYWGDGSSIASSASGNVPLSHTYTAAGEYYIAVVPATTGLPFTFGYQSSSYNYGALDTQNYNSTSESYFRTGTWGYTLKSILMPSFAYTGTYTCKLQYAPLNCGLKFISLYKHGSTLIGSKGLLNCSGIQVIAGNDPLLSSSDYMLANCTSLGRLTVGKLNGIAANTLAGCSSLKEVAYNITSGGIAHNKMNVQWAMIMLTETPPAITAAAPVWGTKPIYVPDSAVETYKAASGWSAAADFIFPMSEYPD